MGGRADRTRGALGLAPERGPDACVKEPEKEEWGGSISGSGKDEDCAVDWYTETQYKWPLELGEGDSDSDESKKLMASLRLLGLSMRLRLADQGRMEEAQEQMKESAEGAPPKRFFVMQAVMASARGDDDGESDALRVSEQTVPPERWGDVQLVASQLQRLMCVPRHKRFDASALTWEEKHSPEVQQKVFVIVCTLARSFSRLLVAVEAVQLLRMLKQHPDKVGNRESVQQDLVCFRAIAKWKRASPWLPPPGSFVFDDVDYSLLLAKRLRVAFEREMKHVAAAAHATLQL
jgi:hypothetical protein